VMLASISGSAELAKQLLSHGAKVNATNPGGVTALMIAAANDHAAVVELLLSSGADVDARSEDGRTALSIAQQANSNAGLIKLLEGASHRGTKAS
jgi:ankyrin repeat protein